MDIRGFFFSMEISASGLSAQRQRMNSISNNIANASTTHTEEGGPYKKQVAVLKEMGGERDFRRIFETERKILLTTHRSHLPFRSSRVKGRMEPTGVKVEEIVDLDIFKRIYDPSHPDSDEEGYVAMPDINIVSEMVDMLTATRSYEANVTAFNAAKTMAKRALEI